MGKKETAVGKAPKPVSKSPSKVEEMTEKPAKKTKKVVKAPEFLEGAPKIMKRSTAEKFGMKKSEDADLLEKTSKIEAQLNEKDSSMELERVKVKRKSSDGTTNKSDESKIFMSLENEGDDNKPLTKDQKKRPRENTKKRGNRAVIKLSNIPHGFYENEMMGYFSQFGAVTNLKVYRSRKTGGLQGGAIVEFKYREVAEIVCETMNNYLMFDCILKCKILPDDKCYPKMFYGKINPKNPPIVKNRRELRASYNSDKTEEHIQKKKRKIAVEHQGANSKIEKDGYLIRTPDQLLTFCLAFSCP